jgi:hypothetical protein
MFRAAEEMLRTEGKSLDQAKGPMYDQTKYGPTTSSTAKARASLATPNLSS